jgi:hypothetical protein
MARASTEGERARTLLPYWGLRALHTVTRVHVLAPQPNALLGARSNVARISQRGPHMLLAGEGLRSARAMPLLPQATESKPTHTVTKMASTAGEKKFNIDIQLILYFALWYLGNYYYNISNKMALKAAGGAAGFPLTIATLQLGVGMLYALFLWVCTTPSPTVVYGFFAPVCSPPPCTQHQCVNPGAQTNKPIYCWVWG